MFLRQFRLLLAYYLRFGDPKRYGIYYSVFLWNTQDFSDLIAVKPGHGNHAEAKSFCLKVHILGGVTDLDVDIVVHSLVVESFGHFFHITGDDEQGGWVAGSILNDRCPQGFVDIPLFD